MEQASDDSVLVTPVKLAPVANANAVLRCRVADGTPVEGTLQAGSFIEMAPEVVTDLATPMRYVDAVLDGHPGTPPAWLSAVQLHDQPRKAPEQLLRDLNAAELDPGFLDPAEGPAFEAFLLASTDRPASAGTHHGWGMGIATATGVAIVIDGTVLVAGDTSARDELVACRTQWLDADKPDVANLVPGFAGEHDGWAVRAICCGKM